MIITQKVTTLAFSIHDGVSRDECELSKSQQYHAVRKLPSALEYFAYMLHFQGLLAGPLVFYRDYIEFIEGYHILKHTPSSNVSVPLDTIQSHFILLKMQIFVGKLMGSLTISRVTWIKI